jgi:CheY-like chemotaxis protein
LSKKILIADDEPNIVAAVEFLLQRSGYEVQVARNGDEALKLVEATHPDLVLLDVMMPQKSGYEVCMRMRADWRHIGGMLPLTATAMVAATGDIYYGLWYPIVVAIMTVVIGAIFLTETKNRDIRTYDHSMLP